MLEIRNISKSFGSFRAVNNFSLVVKPGDFFGFLGPNGAGKTTTIKMVAGLLKPDTGEILINNYSMNKSPIPAKSSIGYIPDQPFLYDRLTGREFLHFSGGLYHMPYIRIREKTEELCELLQIGSWVDRRTEEYSQGMRQRIAIASGLIHNPPLILVDEPMVGLDPQSAKLVKELFQKLSSNGTAILMSTHSLHIAEEICSRIGVIRDGEIIFNDDLSALKSFWERESHNLESFFLELMK